MKSVCLYDQLYDLCDCIGFRSAERSCICIPGRVCAERFLTCVQPFHLLGVRPILAISPSHYCGGGGRVPVFPLVSELYN